MRQKLLLFLSGIALFSGAALLNAQVKTDYGHSASFSSYKTYSWLKVESGDSLWIAESSRTLISSWRKGLNQDRLERRCIGERFSKHP
jgi:hypothetical protein